MNLSRSDRYPKRLIEKACALALEQGVRSPKAIRQTVESLLQEAIVQIETPGGSGGSDAKPSLTQVHELIRQTSEYAVHFKQTVSALQCQSETKQQTQGVTPA